MTKSLVLTHHFELLKFENYGGVCHSCNSPVEYKGEFIAVVALEEEDYMRIIPVDNFKCPYCGEHVKSMMIYKKMDITEELATL